MSGRFLAGSATRKRPACAGRFSLLLKLIAGISIDIKMLAHHDAMMRTTLDLPDDLHRIATSLARHNKRSLGQIVGELMRRGLEAPAAGERVAELTATYSISPVTGLAVVRSPRPITDEDVKALDDEG